MAIEWDETVETKRKVRMVVSEYGPTFRDATIDDLRRACEAAGLVVETREEAEEDREDRSALRESLQQMHDERIACLNALAESVSVPSAILPRMVQPSSVLAGIRSLQGRLRDARSDYREHDAELEAAVERAEKAEADLTAARGELASSRARVSELTAECERQRSRIAELEAPLPKADEYELLKSYDDARESARRAWAQNGGVIDGHARGIRAVAERIRRERPQCLIERAVAGGVGFEVWRDRDGLWMVRLGLSEPAYVPDAEVRRVLARMLTEVGA